MIVLGIDIETTGRDPKEDEITEIAYCLYDLIKKQEIYTFSALVKGTRPIPDEVVQLNGITNEMRAWGGMDKEAIKPNMRRCFEMADFIAAHNAEFEKGFIGKNLGRPWIDTMVDVPYPAHITTRKLTHLCADHGIYIHGAHRALNDVRAMLEILTHYDPLEVKRYAESPTLTVQALVEYDTREKAKARSYRWNGERKIWTKTIKEFQLQAEREASDFIVVVAP